ncbi:MAG: ATP-dependent helicase, partial [Desulfobacteraceae bacterium]
GQAEVLAEFFLTDIIQAMGGDLFLSGFKGEHRALVERTLLYLHDVKVITLQNGLGVFRQAMTITMAPQSAKRRYTKGDYQPLSHHYDQKNVQVHVMERFARLGLEKIKTALHFVSDYFSSSHDRFIRRHFPGEEEIIQTAMTAEAYKKIVQSLGNSIQESIVAADTAENLLVLAGPGSGKTKTIVHRCAWLIRAKSVDPRAILVLCFNHQAMVELKKRIRKLAGPRGNHVTAMTYHGFAMRLAGRSFVEGFQSGGDKTMDFNAVIDEATAILSGEKALAGTDPAEARDHHLAGFRYVLVDEYQDIDQQQYDFISALTGRLAGNAETKIAIMAVGDDDQSIYGFRRASVAFIRQFQQDYKASTFYLVENYRSSHPIIQASTAFIAQNRDRMKTGQPCRINTGRAAQAKEAGKISQAELVQVVHCQSIASQALFTAQTIGRLLAGDNGIPPGRIAVVARQGIAFPPLVAVRMALARENIEFCYAMKSSAGFPMFKIREIQVLIQCLDSLGTESITPGKLKRLVMERFPRKNSWTALVEQLLEAWCRINPDMAISAARAKQFALETLLEERREHKTGSGVFLGTVHSVKGMEFSAIFILDGGWQHQQMEEERRLFYVGMTRAEKHLFVCAVDNCANPHISFLEKSPFVHRQKSVPNTEGPELKGFSHNMTISILGMADLFLDFPGRFPPGHQIHGHLAALETGDKVSLVRENHRVFICNRAGHTVASLSQKAAARWRNRLHTIVNAKVCGIIRRERRENSGNTLPRTGTDLWELPVVEILHGKLA